MAIELSQAPASAPVEQEQDLKKQVQMDGEAVGSEGAEQSQSQGQVQMDLELHRACASGSLDNVRAVLSRGLEQLEILDMSTGCTPIVLAIRGNHVDVVRELLSAGAIVPPPGLTNDPTILSLLYPQPMYGIPPPFMPHGHGQQPMPMMAPEFYPQSNGFYGNQMQAQAQANLPPADVAKTIPCRNFPNCKYGASCVFFHPRGQAFYPPGQGQGPAGPGPFQGYEGYQQGFQPMPYYNPAQQQQPNGFQPAQPQGQEMNGDVPQQSFGQGSASSNSIPVPGSETDNSAAPQQFNESMQHDAPPQPPHHELSSAPAPFVPFGMTSPVAPPFGLSPMSPPMMHMQMAPHEAGFYASSPPNGHGMMAPPPMNGFVPRRLSNNQGPGGYAGKPFGHGHGKKPSFSGGSRPWAGSAGAGAGTGAGGARAAWKDGTPPPCAFFAQSKCRNGEFCKFPHIDQEGNDTRHPDVIRGVMAPAPPLARVQRPMRMGNFSQFDPTRQFVPRAPAANGHVNGTGNGDEASTQLSTPVETIAESSSAPVDVSASTQEEQAQAQAPSQVQAQAGADAVPVDLPAKPTVNGNGIARSASQPGVQRFQANGFHPHPHSRSQSPAPSNVSFNGNGHPRRAGRPFNASGPAQGAGAGVRSVSAGENKQRIPGADEFPALGGAGSASGNTSPQEKSTAAFSKTAAQVLSAPAPPKPEPVAAPAPTKETTVSEDGVTMDDESDSDAVIVTMNKPTEKEKEEPASTSTPTPAVAAADKPAPAKPSSISFASVASAIKEISTGTTSTSTSNGSIDAAPVALKA